MIFASLLSLSALATLVTGHVIQERSPQQSTALDIKGITTVLDRVKTGITKADADVKLWLDDYDGCVRILEDARWVHQDMHTGAQFIASFRESSVGTVDAITISIPMAAILSGVESYINGLIQKKSVINRLGM